MTFAPSRSRRRVGLAAGALVLVLSASSACSVEQTMLAPWCNEDRTSVVVVAQSVRTATQIPCLLPLPDGWSVDTVKVNEHHTVVTLDSDRAGDSAAVLRLEDGCDVTRSVSAPTDIPSADRYDLIEQVSPSFQATRSYVFPGGCVSWTFDFDAGTSATESVAVGSTLALFPRQELNDNIRDSLVDEEL